MRSSLTTIMLMAFAASLTGQEPPSGFEKVAAGRNVRVRPGAGQVYEGVVAGWVRDTLLVHSGSDQLRIPVAALDAIWVRRDLGRAVATGAAIGFVPGFLLGFLWAGGYCNWGRQPNDCGDTNVGSFTTFGVITGLPPAAIGALIGVAVGDGWRAVPLHRPAAVLGVDRGRLSFRVGLRF